MLDQLVQFDKNLFILLNNLGSENFDSIWLILTHKLTHIPLYAVLLYLFYRHLGWKTFMVLAFVIAIMIVFTDQLTNLFKYTVQRPRPCRERDLQDLIRYIAPRCGRYGFFSGHASNSMAVAVFAGLLLKPYYRNLVFILLFWSAVVAYSRIYVGVHYPVDMICGMIFGALSGFGFYLVQKLLRKKFIS